MLNIGHRDIFVYPYLSFILYAAILFTQSARVIIYYAMDQGWFVMLVDFAAVRTVMFQVTGDAHLVFHYTL